MCSNRRFSTCDLETDSFIRPCTRNKETADCAERRPMQFLGVIKQAEVHTKLVVQ